MAFLEADFSYLYRKFKLTPLTLTLYYVIVAITWILLSDYVFHFGKAKGNTELILWILVIGFSGSILYLLLRNWHNRLISTNNMLKAIIATEPECVKLVGPNGRLIDMNPAGLAMLEVDTLQEAQRRKLTDYVLPQWRGPFIAMLKQVMNGEKAYLEFEIAGIGGTHRWLETNAVPMRDAAGNITMLLGITRDVTERKNAECELIKLSQAVDQSPNSTVITDVDGNINYVNSAFLQTTGYTLSEVIGKNPRLLRSGKTDPALYEAMWSKISKGETWHGEFINRYKDGNECIQSVKIVPIYGTNKKITHFMAIEEDITEKKENEERIHYLANFDPLTGLPNRAQMDDHLNYTLNLAKRSGGNFTIMFLDLDHFKEINDSLGHSYGDILLKEIAKRLRAVIREEDTLSRLGGDEFIFLLPDTDGIGAVQVAQKLLETVTLPISINKHELTVTSSIGIALYPADGLDIERLLKNADTAMYRAKQEGRNNYCFFTDEMQKQSTRNLHLSNALRHAVERNELSLMYQPQLSATDGRVVGAEALLRWNHPQMGSISPAEFIPIAEKNGLILPIGEWVLQTAATQAKVWLNNGYDPIVMAVNLSAVQFQHQNLIDTIARILEKSELPPEYLELELTEGVAMRDPQKAITIMNELHNKGVRMSIDDFGTGYSSLSYLKKFKVYKLKIDQSFVRDISTDPDDKAIVSTVISMARHLGLQTIAEGVETVAQLHYLKEQGCDEVQGYYFAKPLSAEAFETFRNTLQPTFSH